MQGGERRVIGRGYACIKILILLFGDLLGGPCPKGSRAVQLFAFIIFANPENRLRDVIGIFANQMCDPWLVEIFLRLFSQMYGDICANRLAGCIANAEAVLPVAFPTRSCLRTVTV